MKYQGQGYVALVEATLKLHVTASTFKPLYIYIYIYELLLYICPGIQLCQMMLFIHGIWENILEEKQQKLVHPVQERKPAERGPAPS